MAKLVITLGLATSLAIFAIALLGASATGNDVARKYDPTTVVGCTVEELPLDEGYGVSRTLVRRTCAK